MSHVGFELKIPVLALRLVDPCDRLEDNVIISLQRRYCFSLLLVMTLVPTELVYKAICSS
jgi:hypothetical protein